MKKTFISTLTLKECTQLIDKYCKLQTYIESYCGIIFSNILKVYPKYSLWKVNSLSANLYMIINLMLIKSSIQESNKFWVIVTSFFISSPTFQLVRLYAYPACMLWGTLAPALLKRAFVNFILNCGSIYIGWIRNWCKLLSALPANG